MRTRSLKFSGTRRIKRANNFGHRKAASPGGGAAFLVVVEWGGSVAGLGPGGLPGREIWAQWTVTERYSLTVY